MFDQSTAINEEEAYILGFLYADGFITGRNKNGKYYSVGATISEKDAQLIDNIRRVFDQAGYVSHVKAKSVTTDRKIYNTTAWRIGNVELVGNLRRLGISENKTYEQSSFVFDNVPDQLKHHFVRGYFDGDGSIYHPKNSNKHSIKIISLNANLIKSIDRWLLQNCNLTIKTDHHFQFQDGKYPRISHNGNPNCIKIRDVLYRDATIFLQRKRDIFFSIPKPQQKKSQYKGVTWDKPRNKWRAVVYLDKENPRVYCGLYKTETEAYEASQSFLKSHQSAAIGCTVHTNSVG